MQHLSDTSNIAWGIRLLHWNHRTPLCTEAGLEALSACIGPGDKGDKDLLNTGFFQPGTESQNSPLIPCCLPKVVEGMIEAAPKLLR